ncbi:MAG: PAS domain S-box protein [Desulfobacterales bacterium]|nr:PAS domain S-box protein [Desulfobacterales bacterium]
MPFHDNRPMIRSGKKHKSAAGRDRTARPWIFASIAMTLVLVGLLVWHLVYSFNLLTSLKEREFVMERCSWQLLLHAETMKMAALIGASSGDLNWETTYRETRPELNALLEKIPELTPSSKVDRLTNEIRQHLVVTHNLEKQAFDLVSRGRKKEAFNLLSGWPYTKNQLAFSDKTQELVDLIHTRLERKTSFNLTRAALLIALICLGVLVFSWTIALKMWRAESREKQAAEQALRRSENYYRAIFETSGSAMLIIEADTTISRVNSNFEKLSGYCRQALEGRKSWPEFVHCDDVTWMKEIHDLRRKNPDAATRQYECRFIDRGGRMYNLLVAIDMIAETSRSIASCIDITGRKQEEKQREKLQARLLQSRKMESVGRLAGGVAHDFNNMLAIINGYAEMTIDMLDPETLPYANIREIYNAGKRSEDIVRQLLAFARKQTIAPVEMDLNEAVSGLLKMLQRLIGENIELVWRPGDNLWPVRIDPSQLTQIMANLAINARDAIADVGQLTIETKNVVVDEDNGKEKEGPAAGQYVMLAVTDNGCGMEKEVQDNLFEPFFTTKETGEGTGLGLSTIYGIVRQHNGLINVTSQPGRGTTFTICLPRCKDPQTGPETPVQCEASLPAGSETILMVEDEAAILQVGREMLESLGYKVLTAEKPEEALALFREYEGTIDLLITDVIMPEMNGRDLATSLSACSAGLRVLFMSGYTADVIAVHGVPDQGVQFMQKPFSIQDLALKVRGALGQQNPRDSH